MINEQEHTVRLPTIESAITSATSLEFRMIREQTSQREFKVTYGTSKVQMLLFHLESLVELHNKVRNNDFMTSVA